MSNTLLITNTLENAPSGGRQLLCKLNKDALTEICGDSLILFELSSNRLQNLKSILHTFKGYLDGLNEDTVIALQTLIEAKNVEKVFVDGSNLGGIVKIIKKKFPHIQLFTFFHNVEARFFLGALKQNKTSKALAVFIVNYLAERKAVRYSDRIICLNERDSQLLERIYGRLATDFSAMALEDKLPLGYNVSTNIIMEKFALFVGGTFYANRAGVSWFVENVAPYISIKTYIVGRGFEKFRKELEVHKNIIVVGEVDTLAQWYEDAYFVVAPIFDGSGMKTKVAEALMYGKKIIGTSEAFAGYEDIVEQAGRVCLTADEFITAIKSADDFVQDTFDTKLRKIYEDHYSYNAAKSRLASIME